MKILFKCIPLYYHMFVRTAKWSTLFHCVKIICIITSLLQTVAQLRLVHSLRRCLDCSLRKCISGNCHILKAV